jgi:hypothetical protein
MCVCVSSSCVLCRFHPSGVSCQTPASKIPPHHDDDENELRSQEEVNGMRTVNC